MKFAEIFISRWMLITARCFLLLVCLFLFFAVSEWSSKFTVHCSKPDYFEYFHCQQWRSRMDGGQIFCSTLYVLLDQNNPQHPETKLNWLLIYSSARGCEHQERHRLSSSHLFQEIFCRRCGKWPWYWFICFKGITRMHEKSPEKHFVQTRAEKSDSLCRGKT